jgi:hypothetical protein
MGWLDTTRIDSLTWATAAALATAQLYPRDTAGYVPVLAEVICWTLGRQCCLHRITHVAILGSGSFYSCYYGLLLCARLIVGGGKLLFSLIHAAYANHA